MLSENNKHLNDIKNDTIFINDKLNILWDKLKNKCCKLNNILKKKININNNSFLILANMEMDIKQKNEIIYNDNIISNRKSFLKKNELALTNLISEKQKYKKILKTYQENLRYFKEYNEKNSNILLKINEIIIEKNILKEKFEEEKRWDGKEEMELKNVLTFKEKLLKNSKYLNELYQNSKGKIRVLLRLKPKNSQNINNKFNIIIKNKKQISLNYEKKNLNKNYVCQEYKFENIYGQFEDQLKIFNDLKYLVSSVIQGSKVNIFAYGATGSGKSYTILGGKNSKNIGIIPRSIKYLFEKKIEYENIGYKIEFKLKIVEIYLDQVKNLVEESYLNDFNKERKKLNTGNKLKYYKDGKSNLIFIEIENYQDAMKLYNIGSKNRSIGSTSKNNKSSRSHFIFNLEADIFYKNENLKGNLVLVDLAGSEKHDSNASRKIQKESNSINLSLTYLSKVIHEIKNNYNHKSFNNNILTRYLHKYLTNGKVLMFINITQEFNDFHNIVTSLKFSETVQNCKTEINSKFSK